MEKIKTLKRYTNLASLISILMNKELTLLDPSKWEDKNDFNYVKKYAELKKFGSLFALCFTEKQETSHHWKAFSPGSDGVCIKIISEPFINYLKSINGVVQGVVDYKYLDEIENDTFTVDQLPFLKRKLFQDESEYRIIFRKKFASNIKTHGIPFDISLIHEITLSNSLSKDLSKSIITLLRSINGCSNLKIVRSTLNDNSRWKNASLRAVLN